MHLPLLSLLRHPNQLATQRNARMGCASSSESPSDGTPKDVKDRSYAIDKQIDDDAKKFRRECKILLLGKSLTSVLLCWGER